MRRRLALSWLIVLSAAGDARPQATDIVRDGSIGPDASVQPEVAPLSRRGNTVEIDESFGSRPGGGTSVFHSFLRFDLGAGDSAIFGADPGLRTDHIIARVTGGAPSQLLGRLGSSAPDASLYFLNPAGILVGSDAQLDLGGSLHLATAHELIFADGSRLSTTTSAAPVLSLAPPSAFGFSDARSGTLQILGSSLELARGRELSLIGADVVLRDATVSAPGGTLRIASVRGQGVVPLDGPTRAQGGRLRIEGSTLSVSGERGGHFSLAGGELLLQDSLLSADTLGDVHGGGFEIAADGAVTLRAARLETNGAAGYASLVAERLRLERSAIVGTSSGATDGGDLSIRVGQLQVLPDSEISRSTRGTGSSGEVDIAVRQRFTLIGDGPPEVTGVELPPPDGFVGTRTLGAGAAGSVSVRAAELIGHDADGIRSDSEGTATGNTGEVSVEAERIGLTRTDVGTSSFEGGGSSQSVRVRARELELSATQIGVGSEAGAAGDLDIETETLRVTNGGIGVFSGVDRSGATRVRTTTAELHGFRALSSGDIQFDATRIQLVDSAIGSASQTGLGGNVSLRAREIRVVTSTLLGSLPEDGPSGTLSIETGSLEIERSDLVAGGQLTIRADDLRASGALIATRRRQDFETPPEPGSEEPLPPSRPQATPQMEAGDVEIDARRIELDAQTKISTSTFGSGRAGDVVVRSDSIVAREGSAIESLGFASTGDAGSIQISTGRLELTGGALIGTSTSGAGRAGDIRIEASESVSLAGAAPLDPVSFSGGPSRIASNARPEIGLAPEETANPVALTGDAGTIAIRTPNLALRDGALISTGNTGPGRAGAIQIETARLSVENGTIATDAIQGAPLGAPAEGSVRIAVTQSALLDGAKINASVQSGQGGDVSIGGADAVLVLRGGSQILAQTDAGNGGRIELTARSVLRDSSSRVSADAGVGQSGAVRIVAPDRDLERGITPLAAEYVDPSALIRPSCEVRTSAQSRFSQRGVSIPPEDLLLAFAARPDETSREPATVAGASRGGRRLPVSFPTVDASDAARQASALNDAGNRLSLSGEIEAALASYQESARLAARAGLPREVARAEANAARAALGAHDAERARALVAAAEAQFDAPSDLRLAVTLARTHADLAQQDPGRRTEALLAAHRLLTGAIGAAQADADARTLSHAYGTLGELYQADARHAEALVLVRRAQLEADRAEAPESAYRWHWREGQLLWVRGQRASAIEAHRRAVAILEQARLETGARSFRDSIAPVYLDLVDAILQRAGETPGAAATPLLLEARDTMELLKAAELRDYFRDECVADLEARTIELDRVAADAAVVYPIALDDRLELLVRLPSGLTRHTVAVPAAQLRASVKELRDSLQDRLSHGYLPPAQRLHDWLIAPYAAALEREGVKTLVFVPDATLRAVPMAALHDGSRFLAQRYALAIAPGLSLIDPRPLRREGARLLLAGVSEGVQSFEPLPEVRDEIRAIQEMFGGRVLLDRDFSPASIDAAVAAQPPSVLHVASHVVFTGDPATSFVLTHDSKLTLDQFAAVVGRTRFREDPLELLVLSACRTAVDDDRAALGLAGIAIRSGARSAVGSLWSLDDDAARTLVVELYRQLRNPQLSRAEALRRAQTRLIEDPELAHPFYWSPFILVSNWL